MQQGKYPLEWLDLLITVTLNPSNTNVSAITKEQAGNMERRLKKETLRLQSLIKSNIFFVSKENEIELLARKYHSTLIILLDQAFRNQRNSIFKDGDLKEVGKAVLTCLNELLSFLETWFHSYLSLDEQVPFTYLSITKRELKRRLNKLKKCFFAHQEVAPRLEIVFNRLYQFTNTNHHRYKVTFRVILYKKELLKGLEDIKWKDEEMEGFTRLDELLIYLNFNSKAYINFLTYSLAEEINRCDGSIAKMDKLLFYYKAFNQFHRKPGIILNPSYHNLETIVGNWFIQEIYYLEKKIHLSVVPIQGEVFVSKRKEPPPTKEKQKVLSILTTDQMGLILRAADELRILVAKSMSEVFKTIVPYLSTPYKENLSFDSMRSKAYAAEERDKKVAIETLELIIKKIREY